MSENSIDGFYVAYFSGSSGTSMGMFVFREGVFTGADIGGGQYSGEYSLNDGDQTRVSVNVNFLLAPGHLSITGVSADIQPLNVAMNFELPIEFSKDDVHRIETPLGPINAKLHKVRGF